MKDIASLAAFVGQFRGLYAAMEKCFGSPMPSSRRLKVAMSVALFSSLALVALPAAAQEQCHYPERPVNVVVGYSSGGGTDTVARILSKHLSAYANGQPFNVINRPGGAQIPAMKFTMGAEKDGYTLQFFSAGSAVLATMMRDYGFEWMEEFQPVSMVSVGNDTLVVNTDSGIQSADDLIAWINESAEKGESLRWGHAGRGAVTHVAGASWLMENDLYDKVQDVPFGGAGEARVALLGNHIDFAVLAMNNVDDFKQDLRGLGVFSEERDSVVSYVPTLQEQNIPFVAVDLPLVLAAAKGVPDSVIDCLDTAIAKVADKPAFREEMNRAGYGVTYMDSEKATRRMIERHDEWRPVMRQLIQSVRGE